MSRKLSPGYLVEIEASHLQVQAMPGAVVVQLRRDLVAEAGQPARQMFIELTLSEAVRHWRDVGELIRRAGALEQATRHVDSAANL